MEQKAKNWLKTIALLAPIASAAFFGIKYVPEYVEKLKQENSTQKVHAIEGEAKEYKTITEKYQSDVESLIQLRDKIDAKLPSNELEKLIVRSLRKIPLSALSKQECGRIIEYALREDKLGKEGAKTTYLWAKQSYERLKKKEGYAAKEEYNAKSGR